MNVLENWVMNEMVEHLEEMEGQVVYGCDLAFKLFKSENIDGSFTCSAHKSREWINEYWDYLGEVIEDYEFNYVEVPINPLVNEEIFQLQIINFLASRLVVESTLVEVNWDEEIELTEETIEQIVSEWKACY